MLLIFLLLVEVEEVNRVVEEQAVIEIPMLLNSLVKIVLLNRLWQLQEALLIQ
jgi:hypothetical protein